MKKIEQIQVSLNELKAVCSEAALFKNRLMLVGLYETMQKMDEVVKHIGYEVDAILQHPARRADLVVNKGGKYHGRSSARSLQRTK